MGAISWICRKLGLEKPEGALLDAGENTLEYFYPSGSATLGILLADDYFSGSMWNYKYLISAERLTETTVKAHDFECRFCGCTQLYINIKGSQECAGCGNPKIK